MAIMAKRNRGKILVATTATIFTLATSFVATIAWFSTNQNVTASGLQIKLEAPESVEVEVKLIRYVYGTIRLSEEKVIEDYLRPENGEVRRFDYNSEAATPSFGYYDNEDRWISVPDMNRYDPIEKVIKGNSFDLRDLNCNAIYEITFRSSVLSGSKSISVSSFRDPIDSHDTTNHLSKWLDFDVFGIDDLSFDTYSNEKDYAVDDFVVYGDALYRCNTATDLDEEFTAAHWDEVTDYSEETASFAVGDFTIYRGHVYECKTAIASAGSFDSSKWKEANTYSSSSTYAVGDVVIYNGSVYGCKTAIAEAETWNSSHWGTYYPSYDYNSSNEVEKTYYKISYLASQINSHPNFYEEEDSETDISLRNSLLVDFSLASSNPDVYEAKLYINANYNPEVLKIFKDKVYSEKDDTKLIEAEFDFGFAFSVGDAS